VREETPGGSVCEGGNPLFFKDMAKQRRNRERATELMTLLEELVPPNNPFRSKDPGSSSMQELPKRSRNKVLEDTIAAVSKAVMQDMVKVNPAGMTSGTQQHKC